MNTNPLIYKNEIPRESRSRIALLFELAITNPHYYGLMNPMLSSLRASEVGLVRHLLGINPENAGLRRYMNPLRDYEPDMIIFDELIEKGYKIMMLGDDLPQLMNRITKPEMYWPDMMRMYPEPDEIAPRFMTWVMAIPPAPDKSPNTLLQEIEVEHPGEDPLAFCRNQILFQVRSQFRDRGIVVNHEYMPTTSKPGGTMMTNPISNVDMGAYIFTSGIRGASPGCRIRDLDLVLAWNRIYYGIDEWESLPYLLYDHNGYSMRYARRLTDIKEVDDLESHNDSLVLWNKEDGEETPTILRPNPFGMSFPVIAFDFRFD